MSEEFCSVLGERYTALIISEHRYEKVRRMNPREFAQLFEWNLKGHRFDDLVDNWPNVPTDKDEAIRKGE